MRYHLAFVLFAPIWFTPYPLFAQTPAPLQAELVQRLNAGRAKVGDSILAKLPLPWKSSACDLSAGAIIQGRVVAQKAHSKTEKTSEIGIVFESGQCGGREMKPLYLTLATVIAPDTSRSTDSFDSEEMEQLGSAIGLGLTGTISRAPATVYVGPRRAKAARAVLLGQVVGISHLEISVGQGPGGASILRSKGSNVQLSPGTRIVLVPNLRSEPSIRTEVDSANPNTATGSSVPTIIELPTSTIAEESEVCVAPDCAIALKASRFDQGTPGAQITLPLKGLGYLPPSLEHEMSGFDYDASIAYLGPDQFLFSFNLHTLVRRSAADAISLRRLCIVRGVLIDLHEKKVARTVDWRVPDSGRYLWPIGQNRVLIHVGQELRVYGPGLELLDKISLGGPLAFVQISPDSELFAVGVSRERHPPEIHRQLEEAEVREPEEDIEIRLLDSHFRLLTTIMRSSRLPPPVLLNEGEVQIRGIARNRWELVENASTGERRVLAVASSTCRPDADTVPGNLLFVRGCGQRARWYRILHGDGKVVLRGESSSSELGQTAGGNVGRNAFAIRIAEATESRALVSVFRPSDLKSSHVAVYLASNGRRIFSIAVPNLALAVQTFAISPREDQVAFLKTDEVAFYRVSVAK